MALVDVESERYVNRVYMTRVVEVLVEGIIEFVKALNKRIKC